MSGAEPVLLLDVNVVLAAHRGDHPHHDLARRWFETVLAGERPFAVPVVVWHSFLRLATNRRIFEVPTPQAEAFAFLDAVCAQPHHRPIGLGTRHLPLLRTVCDDAEASGDLVPDAVVAALALEHGGEVVTLDRDFARFPSVPSRRPDA